MRKIYFLLVACMATWNSYAQTSSIAPGLNDSLLIVNLRSNYYPTNPRGYDIARNYMYSSIDVDATDSLTCVYSGLRAKADGTRTPSNGSLSFNTEHSWPQSFYDEEEPMRGDIHHLYPVWSSPNSSRGNHPFAEIDDNLTTSWWFWENGGSVSSIPSTKIDEYSEYYNNSFEPREDHKGNVARAMFYFWTLYQTNNDIITDTQDNTAFFEGMKSTLYAWHKKDPVDAAEVARSLAVEAVQGNRNPFVHDTTLVRRAYFYTGETTPDSTVNLYISEVFEANGGTVKYVEIYNNSEVTVDLGAGNYQLLRYSNSSTSAAIIGLTGTIAAHDFYVIGDDNPTSGVQTIFGNDVVDVNSGSINHNGNDKYELVRVTDGATEKIDAFGGDNIGNSSNFAMNQVAYRIASALPNNGDFSQTTNSSDGGTVASGYWKVFDVSADNANAKLIASPGYNSGIESDKAPEVMISGEAGWRLISIPGSNASLQQLSDDTPVQGIDDGSNSNVYLFNNTGAYSKPSSNSATIANGDGLLIYFFDNSTNGSSELPIVLDTNLEEPDADVTVSLNTVTATGSSYFTLVGNPFQSNFDVSSITYNNSFQNNIHVLNDGLYSAVSRTSAVVKPWQAFWVESPTVNPSTSITFPLSGKVNASATEHAFSKVNPSMGELSLSLKAGTLIDSGCRISFSNNASFLWDAEDATKLQPTRESYSILYCINDDINQSVLSLPMGLNEAFSIPLGIDVEGMDEQLEFEWELDSSIADKFEFTLVDEETGATYNLTKNELPVFQATSKKGKSVPSKKPLVVTANDQPRFELIVKPVVINASEGSNDDPASFLLSQNYPNPFNPSTVISYQIPTAGFVDLKVFDLTGREVANLVSRIQGAGSYEVTFDGVGLSSGVYVYKLEAGGQTLIKKMTLLK